MYVKVILNTKTLDLNKTFDYKVPHHLKDKVVLGSRVFIPFGKGNSKRDAFVLDIMTKSEYATKEILEVLTGELLSESKIKLAKIMSKRYFCNLSSAIKLMLNPGYRKSSDNIMKELEEKHIVFNYLTEKDLEEYLKIYKEKSNKTLRITSKQKEVLDYARKHFKNLRNNEGNNEDIYKILEKDLIENIAISISVINTMINNGIINRIYESKKIEGYKFKSHIADTKKVLNKEQKEAYNKIISSIKEKKYEEYLLHGVTSSGKTEVYLQIIDYVLKMNKTAIVLVPEIALTPQMIKRFTSRFGEENLAILHSRLTDRERFEEWIRIEKGEAKIVIGTRSAIFAPINNLGIIIIDEEHDSSYKSEITPKYHATEIARYFAKTENAVLLLGSATPLIETYYKTQIGKIKLLELTKRANNAKLPNVEIIDLRKSRNILSKELISKLIESKEDNKQSIIFLNKRGYSRLLICDDCGHTISCPKCQINLRYHKQENILKCHYCGYELLMPKSCPKCNGILKQVGIGIQQLEEMLKKEIDNLSTTRLDFDSVKLKDSHGKILEEFKNNKIDALIGTQMVTKGHDFPQVNLSSVILADNMLNIENYRANEMSFQTLVQIIGRAGRDELNPGIAIIQTYNPDHYIIELAQKQNYKDFYDSEIEIRKMLKYPPFVDILLISIFADTNEDAEKTITDLYRLLNKTKIHDNIQIFEPQAYRVTKIQNKYRWKIILKLDLNNQISYWINKVVKFIKIPKGTNIIIELNPYNI